mgnify:CR=1 FL=1
MNTDNLPNDQEEVAIEFEKGAKAKAKWVAKKEGDGLMTDVLGKFHYDFRGLNISCTIRKNDAKSGVKSWSSINRE